jgi:hypothetical protein
VLEAASIASVASAVTLIVAAWLPVVWYQFVHQLDPSRIGMCVTMLVIINILYRPNTVSSNTSASGSQRNDRKAKGEVGISDDFPNLAQVRVVVVYIVIRIRCRGRCRR